MQSNLDSHFREERERLSLQKTARQTVPRREAHGSWPMAASYKLYVDRDLYQKTQNVLITQRKEQAPKRRINKLQSAIHGT